MANTTLARLCIGGLLLGAGVAHAAGPTSISEVPASWYADRIATTASPHGATQPVFPSAAYEHGSLVQRDRGIPRPSGSIAGASVPFPSSPNETGRVL